MASPAVYTLMCNKVLRVREAYIEHGRARRRKGANSTRGRGNQEGLIRLELSPER